ncbi:MAG: efflux transporter outer membrane subunit [Lysobacteraceae bacterium]
MRKHSSFVLSSLIAAALLSGCTVGPDYVRPEAPVPTAFDQADAASVKAPLPTGVWQSFGDAALDALLAQALRGNTQIAQALARLEESRAISGLSIYSLFPTVTAAGEGTRTAFSSQDPMSFPGLTKVDTYEVGFDASWEIDLFGSVRNPKRAVVRRTEAAAAQWQYTQLSVIAETAQAYFSLRGAQQRLQLDQRNLSMLDEAVNLVVALEKAGRRSGMDVTRLQAERAALSAGVASSETAVVRQEQRLAVLTALPLADLREVLATSQGMPNLPVLQAVGTPEDWLRRRPDVQAAERELMAATHDVGTEIAEYFPKLNLLGAFGWTAQSFGDLGSGNSERWRWGPSLSWQFLNLGRVRQNVKAAEARADGAAATYQQTVLLALEETENALSGYRAANRAAYELSEAASRAGEAAEMARIRFERGADDALVVIDAERTRIGFEQQAVDAQTQRATALVAVYKALAGDFATAVSE